MGIRFRCHHCEHELNLKNFQAGRRARCPVCSGRFRVPTSNSDFSTPLEDDEQELASTALRADQPGAGQSKSAPSFDLKQPTGDLERFKRSLAETERTSTSASPTSASPTSASPTSASPTSASPTSASPAESQASVGVGKPAAAPVRKQAAPSNQPASKQRAAAKSVDAKSVDAKSASPVSLAASPSTDRAAAEPAATQARPAAGDSAAATQPAPAVGTTPGIPRAIAEAPQAVWYVRPPGGGQFGPADSATFYQWMQENRVARESLVWRDGWPQWMIAADAFDEYYGPRWLVPVTPAAVSAEQAPALSGDLGAGMNATAEPGTAGVASAGGANLAETASSTGLTEPLATSQAIGGPTPVRPLARRKRRKTNYALGITVLAIVAIALVGVLVAVLMWQ